MNYTLNLIIIPKHCTYEFNDLELVPYYSRTSCKKACLKDNATDIQHFLKKQESIARGNSIKMINIDRCSCNVTVRKINKHGLFKNERKLFLKIAIMVVFGHFYRKNTSILTESLYFIQKTKSK